MFGLDHLISPVTVHEFLSRSAGEEALYIPGQAKKFPEIFAWEQINDQINYSRPSRESIRLIYEKQPLEHNQLSKLAEWMVKGATLVINSVQQIDPIIAKFSAILANDLNAPINVNCYASYPSKQGFDTHYDNHDVFIVHTSGEKSWKVYEPTRKYPLDSEVYAKPEIPEDLEPYLECTLQEGDVLYIPRGHWHAAIADTPSVHLTVSSGQRSGIDFLTFMIEQLRTNDEFLRKDFPVVQLDELGGNRSSNEFNSHIELFRQHVKNILDDEALYESFLQFCMVKNPLPRNFQLPDLALLKDEIDKTTEFKMAGDQKVLARYNKEDKQGLLIIRGHVLTLKNIGEPIVGVLSNGSTGTVISGKQLLAVSPDSSWEDIKAMLVFLFENGILELAMPHR